MGEVQLIGAAQMSELRTALRDVSDEVADVVASELEDIAKAVASDARARVPYRSGRAQSGYQAIGQAVTWGPTPYVPWLEFGGDVGRKGSVRRRHVRGGRYLYPAIGEHMADIEKRVDDLIEAITNGYLEVE